MFGNDISQVAAQAKEFERSGKRDKFLEESANAVYDDGEGRQLFPVEIDPAMDRYLRQKGEGWQADAWNSYQRGKMLAADLRKGGDDPLRAEKMRVLGEERERLKNYFVARKRRGLPFFTDVLRFQAGVNEDAAAERRKDKEVWHRSVFCGDLKKIPEGLKKRFAERKLPDGEIGDEMRYRSIVFGWALNEGGYAKWQVEAGNGVPVLEQMCIRLKEQGEQVDFNKPGQTVYMFLSRQAQKDAQADELLKGAAESVRQAVLTGGDGRQALWEQRGQMGEDMYKKVGNTLRWVKADAERTRRGLEPVLPRVMEGLEWAVKYADGTANRIFQPEGMASIHQALKAMDGLTDAQMDALAEIVQRKGGNERSYMANVWKAGNRGWEDLGNGIRSLLRGGIAAQLDVAGGVKELFGGDGSALKADAKAADEYGRRLDAFLAMAQGTYRPINKPEYGWFGNGVLSAVRSVPITALSFSGVGAGVAAMSYAGDSYSKAVQERPDGGRLARLGGAAASGAVQGALDRAGAIVAKGVMGLRSGSAFVDKWMSKLSLSRQAMRLKSSALRAGARSGVAGGMVLGEEMTTEKLQDLADPVMQSLASVMAGEAPGIDWERFWKDFTNRDQNMELFGSVLAFALVGAGARFTAEAGMQRQLSREYGKLKRTFGFSDSLLARMRAEESDVARYAMMQDGIQDFMRQNYGKEVDGVKVGLGDADGMRKLAARGGVRTMDVVAAAEAHAAETARGVDEVRVDGAEVQEGKGAVVGVKGPESGGVSEVGSGPVLSFEHGPVPERKGGRQVDEKEAMKQYVEAVNEQLREFGASPIREEMNEFTEEMQYVVELGDRPEFYDTYDDAYEAVLRHLEEREDEVVAGLKSSLRQYRDKDEGYVGRVQDEANEEMMQHLSDVGQDGRMSFDRSKLSVPMTLAQLKTQGDFMRKSAEGRERIYAAQMGVEAGVDAARLRVYGANVAQEFANGRYEVVSRLYRGANPFDVYEEWTEGMTKVLIKDNEWTVAEFEDELKRLEGATGETFLATGEGVDRLQAVCEGVSKAARAHLMGHISDERLPDKLRRWFKMFALLFAKYFEFAQDVMLAKKMLGADVQGKMSEKFRRLLNDFAGFDEAAIAERARREEQAQIEAEAMGDVPEIGEWVAGRLPHPKTAAEAGSDLTGELQRIYDALTTTRTAKGRRRKDGTLGKSFEQRVVARAEQFFSREGRVSDVLEAANEAGFDFADSGELLSAVYDSVVYGYKRYAARGEGQEVSFSMGDRVRRVPMAEARRVADAFHRVEGMEPVAADVPAAYASDLKDALGDIRERYRVLQKETQEQGYALVMGDGKRVQVGGKGWREVKQHAADRRVLAALAVLPELAGRAEFIYSGENSDLKRKPNIARFHYYLTKADFKGASDDGSADLAYVNIAVAEGKNGELFYDLDASTVEDVDSMKGTSATLQRPRVPNTGEAGDGVPHKGRVALLKEFVNYVDRDLAGQGREGREVSVQDVEAQGGFDEHGVLAAENAVVVKPDGDVTMSVRALHASPHSFRKFDTAFMGKGEGAQAYGWGLYFAENPKVNRSYLNQFAQDKATWRFRELEASNVDDMARGLRDRIVFPEHVNRFEPGVLDAVYSVLGDLSDARGDKGKIEAIKEELREDIRINEGYSDQYPQAKRQADAENIAYQYLLDHLDEIEVRTGMPSNYRVELNVEDYLDFMEGGELLFWDKGYGSSTTSRIGDWLLDEGKEEAYSLFNDKDPENGYWMGGKIYRSLEDALGSPREASEFLLRHGVKGIRYADGFSRWKAEEKQTYNYVIFDGNDIKITAFADESTGGAWADYEDPTATFSLSEGFPRRVSRGTQNLEVVHRIAADLRADAATWGRYDGKTDEAAFLVNVGRNVALVKSALMHLPAGYRVAVKPYIDRLQILAELAAKGKINETRMVNAFARREIKREMAEATREGMEEAEITARVTAAGTAWEKGKKPTQKFAKEVFEDEMEKVRKAWAEKRLHELMAEVMEKAAGKLEALAKDGVSAGMARMLDQVLTIRKKNGKQQKGKVSMEAYAYLTDQVVPLLRMTAMEKEAAMNEAAAELDKLEKENPDQMDGEAVSRMEELREELTRLALYGNLEGMSVDEAQAAAKALEIYINTEKEGWAAVQEAAAERLNAIGRRIVEKFNQTGKKADENTLRAANEKFHGKVSFKNFGDFMENMDQLLTRMGTMPALQEFSADMRSRLTNAFQQMRDARGLRAAAVQDLYEKHLTEKVMKARKVGNMAGWVTWFKTSHDTKVRLNGWVTQTARLTLEQAREVREMDARQRKEFIRKRWEEGMEYFSEETLDLLLARLREHEEAAARARAEGRRPVYRKYVTAKASFKGEESSPLVLSRDNALYLVLQSEQEDYREMMKQQGYTPEVISALREYVGEEGMAIGYGLRELLKAQGDKIGRLYEQVTGVPFPRVENYFPARFWALDAMSDADAADMISGVPGTKGGNQGWQKVRTKHHRRLDTSVGALSVFWEATDMTDHWYYTQDITADFRGLLRRREVAESLVANLGKDDFVRLRRWVDLLERAGVVQGQAVGSLDKLLNAVYSGQAKAILAYRFETLMKQGSAVLNAWIGDPGIGFWDYLGTMAKMRNGTAEMGVIKMMKSAEFQARLNDRVDVETLSRLRDDSSYTLAEAALVWGMNGIEYTDVFFNAVGSAALWNIKYRQAVKAGVEEGRAKDEAWQAVRNALHSAQPQTWIDKSFGGLHRGAWGRAIFYMMSENYNKTAAIYGLARAGFAPGVTPKQRWASLSKAGKVWLAYGAFNAIIGAILDYMKDDEEEWEKRDWQGYLFAALAGPIAGMPLVGEAVEWLFSELLGAKVYTGSAGRALIDFRSGWNAAWKLGEMMQEGGHEAGDYMKQVIRLGRVFGAAGGIASGMTNKAVQIAGQYMTLGAALMNPVKTVTDVVD